MWKFIVKRLIMLIPVLIGVTLLVFLILQLAPGDPAKVILGEQATPEQIQELRDSLGLNDPVLVQYANYIIKLVQGDMGDSYKTRGPVSEEVFNRFPNTIKLTACAMLLAVVVAVPLGVVAAVKQNTLFDSISMVIALIGVSMPIFWLGLLLILLFSLKLGLFPSSGSEGIKSIVLPAVALGFNHMASIARTTRSSMLETIRQDYIRTVRAKGVAYGVVIRKHALKNALIHHHSYRSADRLHAGRLGADRDRFRMAWCWPTDGGLHQWPRHPHGYGMYHSGVRHLLRGQPGG